MDRKSSKGSVVKDTFVMPDVPECSKMMPQKTLNKITEQDDVLVPPYPSYLPYTGDPCLLPSRPFKNLKHQAIDFSMMEQYQAVDTESDEDMPRDYSIKTRRTSHTGAANSKISVLHEDSLVPHYEYDLPDSRTKASNIVADIQGDNFKTSDSSLDGGEMDLLDNECILGFVCRFCSKTCDDLFLLDEHVREYHARESTPDVLSLHPYQAVRCSFCTIEFSLCFKCGEECSNMKAIEKHCNVHKARHFTCKICMEMLPVKNNEFHLFSHEDLLPICNECNRKINQPCENLKPTCKVKPMRQDLATPVLPDPIKKDFNLRKKDPIVLLRRLQIEPGIISVRLKPNSNEIKSSPTKSSKRNLAQSESIDERFIFSDVKSNQPLFCDECGYCYFSLAELEIHTKTHTMVSKESVSKELSFDSPLMAQMQEHAETERTATRKPCTFCEAEFYSDNVLENHMIAHIDNNFACRICDESFYQLYDLDLHLETHDEDAENGDYEKNIACDTCFKTFLSQKELDKHKRTECDMPCRICGKICSGEVSLGLHTELHSINKKIAAGYESESSFDDMELCPPRPHHRAKRCAGASTKPKKRMKSSETESRDCFRCRECTLEFAEKEDLNIHMMNVHLSQNDQVQHSGFYCKECGTKFNKRNSYVTHLWKVHDSKI